MVPCIKISCCSVLSFSSWRKLLQYIENNQYYHAIHRCLTIRTNKEKETENGPTKNSTGTENLSRMLVQS